MAQRKAFSDPLSTPENLDSSVYGAQSDLTIDTGSQMARPVPLDAIWADVTQPRHVIPSRVRGSWAGEPSRIPELLLGWGREVEKLLDRGAVFDWLGYLRVENYFDFDIEGLPAIGQSFIDLLELAKNIEESGLNNPITVSPVGTGYLMHTGERRLLAHHMLNMAYPDEHDRIYAMERQHDVWSQVAENTQRQKMNAISMARSLAKLKLAMYSELEIGSYPEMVTGDGCDRAYYAQAAELAIKHKMTETIMNTLNTKSRGYLTNYNNLLRLSDGAWMAADEMDTPEGRLRDILKLSEEQQEAAIREGWDRHRIQKVFTIVNTFDPKPTNEGSGEADFSEERVFTRVGPGAPKSRFGEGERPAESTTSMASLPSIPDMPDMPPMPASPAESLHVPPTEPMPASLSESMEVPDWAAEEESRTPVSVDTGAAWLLDMLHPLLKQVHPKAGRVAHAIRNRSPEDIRVALVENGGDAQAYQAKLQAEGQYTDEMMKAISDKVWDLLEAQRQVSLRIAAEMMSDDG